MFCIINELFDNESHHFLNFILISQTKRIPDEQCTDQRTFMMKVKVNSKVKIKLISMIIILGRQIAPLYF